VVAGRASGKGREVHVQVDDIQLGERAERQTDEDMIQGLRVPFVIVGVPLILRDPQQELIESRWGAGERLGKLPAELESVHVAQHNQPGFCVGRDRMRRVDVESATCAARSASPAWTKG
jgi:hypothetical protein